MPRSLSDTITRSSAFKTLPGSMTAPRDQLTDMTNFGSNPGALRARTYIPANLTHDAALVVVLHGCTQTAAGYDHGSGWSELAEARGFALLFPEQVVANNPNRCFNWFVGADIAREGGEAQSIADMVRKMIADHGIDPARVFVTGLSAGGAMTAVMLATYPDLFAGGAVIAGLPYGAATSMAGAFDRMRGGTAPSASALAQLVRGASDHSGPWPTLSVWHGDADRTVDVSNGALVVDQWRALHALDTTPTRIDTLDGHRRKTWCDADGRAVIEDITIAGMGHGTPLSPNSAPGAAPGGGTAAPYMLDVGIASTRRIAEFWGLTENLEPAAEAPRKRKAAVASTAPVTPRRARLTREAPAHAPEPQGVQKVIEDALRAAGLMR